MATQPQVEELKALLEKTKNEMEEERQTLERQRLELSEREPELEEQGQKETSHMLMEQEEARVRDKLGEVDDALLRIGAGTYGQCQSCGQDIDIKRLRAMPWTALCRDCAATGQAAPGETAETEDMSQRAAHPIDL